MLHRNMSNFDRWVRALIAAGIVIWMLGTYPVFGSIFVSILLSLFATANAFAAVSGMCFGYSLFNLSTHRENQ